MLHNSQPIHRRISLLLLISFAVSLAFSQDVEPAPPRPSRAAHTTRKTETPLPVPPSAYNAHPKLVILLVIDQFREDYLERYRADFKAAHGFRLFLDHGAYFPDCYYDYANTKTAPGHATLGTGAYTDGHGIGGNEWWDLDRNKDRPISSVEDEHYALVGLPQSPAPNENANAQPGASPVNLRASTFGDELRLATQGQSGVFGISLKDRAAILPAGQAANAAYWIDPQSGAFVSSTFYMQQLPQWAAAFNASGRAAQAMQEAQAFEVGAASQGAPSASMSGGNSNFYAFVGRTPAANEYELDFARALITGEQLGTHPTTDVLTLSLSANDLIGHAVGPDSPAERAMVDSLDTDLDGFFNWLDKAIDGGLGNVWIALSADHGVAPIPADAAKLGINAATIDITKLVANLNEAMNAKFSPGEKVNYVLAHQELSYLSLNQPNFDRAGINEQEAEQAIQNALQPAVDELAAPADGATKPASASQTRVPPHPVLVHSYTRQQLEAGQYPADEFGRLIAHSFTPNGGWYVMTVFSDYQMEGSANYHGTTHFSPWSYDRHVPLGLYGAPFAPGIYHGRVAPVDIASTFAALLGINQPSASVGRILAEALKPAASVTYPKPAPVKSHTARRTPAHAAAKPAPATGTP